MQRRNRDHADWRECSSLTFTHSLVSQRLRESMAIEESGSTGSVEDPRNPSELEDCEAREHSKWRDEQTVRDQLETGRNGESPDTIDKKSVAHWIERVNDGGKWERRGRAGKIERVPSVVMGKSDWNRGMGLFWSGAPGGIVEAINSIFHGTYNILIC